MSPNARNHNSSKAIHHMTPMCSPHLAGTWWDIMVVGHRQWLPMYSRAAIDALYLSDGHASAAKLLHSGMWQFPVRKSIVEVG